MILENLETAGGITMDLQLTGKTALITGASQGIGKAIALALAEEGCFLQLAARSSARLETTAELVRTRFGTEVVTLPCDLSQQAEIERLGDLVKPDILVNNAGAIPPGDLMAVDDRAWRHAWDLKVFGYINLTRRLWPHLTAHAGVVVNIIGSAGEQFPSGYIAGATGNAALMAFTRAMGKAARPSGARVVGINTGLVGTERAETLLRARAWHEFGDEERWRDYAATLPFGRLTSPDEVASAVAFLASPRSGYTNGTILTIDGAPG